MNTSSWVGSNYTPAYASNQVQMWHDFRPDVIEKELAAAERYYGINTLRVYLHNMVYDAEKDLLLKRIEQFLEICRRHGIRPGFVFFDDCWNHKGVTLSPQPPVKGRHNGRWAALQDAERNEGNLPKFRAYVQDIVQAHRDDTRVLWWEVYNEPNLNDPFSAKGSPGGLWLGESVPPPPAGARLLGRPSLDGYRRRPQLFGRLRRLGPSGRHEPQKRGGLHRGRRRWMAPKPSNGEPCEVVHWLTRRKAAGRSVPGVYLCWELMAGNSNCRWYWGTPPNAPEPAVPWCGLMWPDATPVSLAEAEAIHRYATGKRRALFFDDFQDRPSTLPAGWTAYGTPSCRNGVCTWRGSKNSWPAIRTGPITSWKRLSCSAASKATRG